MRQILTALVLALLLHGTAWAQEATEQEVEPAGPTELEQLVADFHYTEESLGDSERIDLALSATLELRTAGAGRLAELEPTLARLAERASLLEEFTAEKGLKKDDQRERLRRLVVARGKQASTVADVAALQDAITRFDRETDLLSALATQRKAEAGDDAEARAEEQARQEELEEQERDARAAAEQARRREEATKDATLKQLYAREAELREALVKVTEGKRGLSEEAAKARSEADAFTARKGELLGRVDDIDEDPLDEDRVAKVDPLLREILQDRREAWRTLSSERDRRGALQEAVAKAEEDLESARDKVAAEERRKSELGASTLWQQRLTVAKTEAELAQAKLDAQNERLALATKRVEQLEAGVEFLSKEVRTLIGRASSAGRDEVYGLLNDEAWADALRRLEDRYQYARGIIEARRHAQESIVDQLPQLALWLGGFAWRCFLGLLLLVLLRFVPVVSRRLLDLMQETRFFRRRPSVAIKIFEVTRSTARPLITYAAASYVFAYVLETFPALGFVQWGIDAFFVYLIGVRVVSTIALPRWYREREGLTTTGTEEDLKPAEAAQADILRMNIERATKFVNSARVVLIVATVWFYAPQIAAAITGVSVLSGLITTATRVAIAVVAYWMLQSWRDELSSVFTRMAGDRIPQATEFVERNKDRRWGVLVVAVVSVVVIAWEIGNFVRRATRNTEWFKRISAYIFKTKIELKQRDEPTEAEIRAMLPDDLEAAFADHPATSEQLVEREFMIKLRDSVRGFVEDGYGAACISGEPGIGKTTTVQWLIDDLDEDQPVVELAAATRLHRRDRLVQLFGALDRPDISDFDGLCRYLEEAPSTVFVLDGLERLFLRDIDGYGAYQGFMDLIHRFNRKHVWIVSASRFGWEFLTRVYDQRHVFHDITAIPRWTDEELRELVETRMQTVPYSTSFHELAELEGAAAESETVKTARGYYRYLAEFSRGLPATAMHYWLRSLSRSHADSFSVSLFRRPPTNALAEAPASYRFVLAAIAQHGRLSPEQAARVDNTPEGTCELAANYFADAGVIAGDELTGYVLTPALTSLALRHLEDSNLL